MNSYVARAINTVLDIIQLLIFIRIILSWIRLPRENPIIVIVYNLTEPILGPIRSLIQKSSIGGNMMFDFSPIVAWLLIALIRTII